MLRPLVIATVALTASSSAASESAATIAAVWDRFEKVCGPAMADAQGFVDGLSSWAPPGSYGTISSPDGKMFRATIIVAGFTDRFNVTVIGGKMLESCATHYLGDGIESSSNTAAAFDQFFAANFAGAEISGGWIPEQYRENYKQPTGPMLNNDANYEYSIEGAPQDADYSLFVQIVDGFMSVSSTRLTNRGQ